jgi:hypothetical protein
MNESKNHTDAIGERDVSDSWHTYEDVSQEFADVVRRKDRQLNLRVDNSLLA